MDLKTSTGHDDLRSAIAALCADFPGEYWRSLEPDKYPDAFVETLTKNGWLSVLIPEEYGGGGASLTEASIILEEISASGGNPSACHAQMYVMGTLLRHGSEAQKQQYLPKIAAGELRLQAFGVTEPSAGSETTKIRTKAERVDGGWKIYGFCERQTTKADVDAMKEQKSRAGKASAEARRNRKDTQIEQSVEHNGNITSTETQPDTDTDTNTNTNTNTKSTRATRLPETWNIGNELYSWTQAEAPNLNMAREAAKFRDYWLSVPGQKGTKTDWDRTWKNWVRNNVERNPALAVVSQQPTKRKITGYDD